MKKTSNEPVYLESPVEEEESDQETKSAVIPEQKKRSDNPLRFAFIGLGLPLIVGLGVLGILIAFNLLSSVTRSALPTYTPPVGSKREQIIDGTVTLYVPAGAFSMGDDRVRTESPIHPIELAGYYMDKYEVTNAAYKRCVDAGTCVAPKYSKSYTRPAYYGNSEFDEYPVIYVNWAMAKNYCEWRNSRLPTEAEWEKAARGTDSRTYPWGEYISCGKSNYDNCKGDTTKVGSYLGDLSPYGIYDMAGNVGEWVSDWYEVYPGGYASASSRFGQKYRTVRGGTYDVPDVLVRSTYRHGDDPTGTFNDIGFRCARSAE